MPNNEIRVLGYCAECGTKITDEDNECYCNDDGEYFCSVECFMETYHIHRLEI